MSQTTYEDEYKEYEFLNKGKGEGKTQPLSNTKASFVSEQDRLFAELDKVEDYIKSTYKEHYVGPKGIQLVDIMDSEGELEYFAKWSAIKYLFRYGKKSGHNKKDLYKAIHLILLLIETTKDNSEDLK